MAYNHHHSRPRAAEEEEMRDPLLLVRRGVVMVVVMAMPALHFAVSGLWFAALIDACPNDSIAAGWCIGGRRLLLL